MRIEPIVPIRPMQRHDSETMTREGWYDRPCAFHRRRKLAADHGHGQIDVVRLAWSAPDAAQAEAIVVIPGERWRRG